jgi:FtsP/CotA-like multicopper oxidase with cupredoxin domain
MIAASTRSALGIMARLPLVLCASLVLLASMASAQPVHDVSLVARPGLWTIAPGQTVTNGWLYNGQLPGPTLRLRQGDRLRVTLTNLLPEPTTIHWHGLPVPLKVDGVPGVSQGPVGIGQQYVYEFTAAVPGTYFYHPHVGLQLDRGLAGALIVDPANPAEDPPYDVEHVVVLDDWLPGAPIMGQDPVYSAYLINGKTSLGQSPLAVKVGDRVRMRFVNASAHLAYAVTVDGHPMLVTHADGQGVVPVTARALPIGPGERWDAYFVASNPGRWSVAASDLMQRGTTLVRAVLAYQGSTGPDPAPGYVPPDLKSAPLLGYAQLASKQPNAGIAPNPGRTHALQISGGMMSYVWTINGAAFPNAPTLPVTFGQKVRLDMTNMSMSHHPMHIHGHFLRVVGSGGGTVAPLVKDTVLLQEGGMMSPSRLDAEFTADNPGLWAFHCHMVYHMEAGLMRLIEYAGTDADRDGVPDGSDYDPTGAWPVAWLGDNGGGFRTGTTVSCSAQWRETEALLWALGMRRFPAITLGELGTLGLADPIAYLGIVIVPQSRVGTLALSIPADAGLVGGQVAVQAVGSHATLTPNIRLSSTGLLTIR